MFRTAQPLILLLAVLGGCSTSAPRFTEPPPGSFASETHQVTIGGTTASLQGASVTKDFFPATNAQPLLGRFFIAADFAATGSATVVLSRQMWNERLGAAATIIGQQVEIDGHPMIVVGIAPPGFDSPSGAQFWTPRRS